MKEFVRLYSYFYLYLLLKATGCCDAKTNGLMI